jgi:hypothetical protein
MQIYSHKWRVAVMVGLMALLIDSAGSPQLKEAPQPKLTKLPPAPTIMLDKERAKS